MGCLQPRRRRGASSSKFPYGQITVQLEDSNGSVHGQITLQLEDTKPKVDKPNGYAAFPLQISFDVFRSISKDAMSLLRRMSSMILRSVNCNTGEFPFLQSSELGQVLKFGGGLEAWTLVMPCCQILCKAHAVRH